MAVQPQLHPPRGRDRFLQFARIDRPGWRGWRQHDLGKAAWRGVVKALGAGFNRLQHVVKRFDRHRNELVGIEMAAPRRAAATKYQADAETARDRKDHLRGV